MKTLQTCISLLVITLSLGCFDDLGLSEDSTYSNNDCTYEDYGYEGNGTINWYIENNELTPILAKDNLLLTIHQGNLRALNLNDGSEVWRRNSFNGRLFTKNDLNRFLFMEGSELIYFYKDFLARIDLASGAVLSTMKFEQEYDLIKVWGSNIYGVEISSHNSSSYVKISKIDDENSRATAVYNLPLKDCTQSKIMASYYDETLNIAYFFIVTKDENHKAILVGIDENSKSVVIENEYDWDYYMTWVSTPRAVLSNDSELAILLEDRFVVFDMKKRGELIHDLKVDVRSNSQLFQNEDYYIIVNNTGCYTRIDKNSFEQKVIGSCNTENFTRQIDVKNNNIFFDGHCGKLQRFSLTSTSVRLDFETHGVHYYCENSNYPQVLAGEHFVVNENSAVFWNSKSTYKISFFD